MSALTVVVASYNHAEFIPRALASVARQSEAPELIVTDDASSDLSQTVITEQLEELSLRARTVFNTENEGICSTFNHALSLVQTPFVAFISADDWMEPERVEKHAAVMTASREDVGLLYGDMFLEFSDGSPNVPVSEAGWYDSLGVEGVVFDRMINRVFIPTPTVVMRTSAIRAVGGYDETLAFEDLDMWLRLTRQFKVAYHSEPLVHYWQHPGSMTNTALGDKPSAVKTRIRAYSKHLDAGPAAREIIIPRLYTDSLNLWRQGEDPKPIAPHIWREARRSKSLKRAALALAALMGVPGRLVRPVFDG